MMQVEELRAKELSGTFDVADARERSVWKTRSVMSALQGGLLEGGVGDETQAKINQTIAKVKEDGPVAKR